MSGLVDYLDKVRAKPEPERRRLLWIWTISLTLVIILGWLLNLYVTDSWHFTNPISLATTTTSSATSSWSQEGLETWYSIKAGISAGWEVVTEKLQGPSLDLKNGN